MAAASTFLDFECDKSIILIIEKTSKKHHNLTGAHAQVDRYEGTCDVSLPPIKKRSGDV
jgi:hypothetical protein